MKQYLISEEELKNVFGWGIDGEDFEYDKFMETLKPVEDLQINKQCEMAEFIKKHQNLRIKLNNYVKKIIELEDQIQQLEKDIIEIEKVSDARWKENADMKAKLTANKFIFRTTVRNEYLYKIEALELQGELQQKAINTLNDSGLKLMGEDKELKDKLANQKYLNRQEVEKIFKIAYKDRKDKTKYVDINELISGICALALPIIKYLTPEQVSDVILNYTNAENKIIDSIRLVTAICNLAVSEIRTSPFTDEQNENMAKEKFRNLITVWAGNINDQDEGIKFDDIDKLADEIISAIGGK